MSDSIRTEYNNALRTAILQHGELICIDPSIYMRRDYSTHEHLRACVLTCVDTPKSDEWDEFAGTFFEDDTRHYGVMVSGVSCECGTIRNRGVRWEETTSRIAEIVFTIAAEKWLSHK